MFISQYNIKMYIAFKWLLGLNLAMWISMTAMDLLVKRSFEIKQESFLQKLLERNTTVANRKVELRRDRYYKHINDRHSAVLLLFFMFLVGVLAVFLLTKKTEIVLFTKRGTSAGIARLLVYSKITVSWLCDCSIKYNKIVWIHIKNAILELWNKSHAFIMRKELQKPKINIILLKKLQEVGIERKKLGQLLISAIHENKNIRMQYELENMAKNRLVRHIEDTQKVMKETRSSYVSFQQLYLVTHQENCYLKSRLNKLTKEKEEVEKNLLELMNEVYKSKNNQLKVNCSRFIVKPSNNLLNSDVGAEIQKFLDKSRSPVATTSRRQISERPNATSNSTISACPVCANPQFADIIEDDILVPLVPDAPKLKGLPGEFVWTVKDKDGLISKLYEYDFTSDLDDGGDTIKRIRQYSVYFDKDCLLDSINSKTVITNESNETRSAPPRRFNSRCDTNYPITTQRFLTGSQAFQKFMRNNKNALISKSATRLPGPKIC